MRETEARVLEIERLSGGVHLPYYFIVRESKS
jgi:hypothetical protein